MDENLAQKTYKFEFFNKKKKDKGAKLSNYLLLCLGVVLAFSMMSRICSDSFDSQLKRYITRQNSISGSSAGSFNSLYENLNKKNWTTVQYHLLMLRNLNSTQIDQKVLTILTDYSNHNLKQQPYNNEFALLTTSYLTSMQMVSSDEKNSIKDMNQILGAPWTLNLIKMEVTFKQQNNIFNKNIIDIKEKANYLIKGLKETPIKKILIESFSIM